MKHFRVYFKDVARIHCSLVRRMDSLAIGNIATITKDHRHESEDIEGSEWPTPMAGP